MDNNCAFSKVLVLRHRATFWMWNSAYLQSNTVFVVSCGSECVSSISSEPHQGTSGQCWASSKLQKRWFAHYAQLQRTKHGQSGKGELRVAGWGQPWGQLQRPIRWSAPVRTARAQAGTQPLSCTQQCGRGLCSCVWGVEMCKPGKCTDV